MNPGTFTSYYLAQVESKSSSEGKKAAKGATALLRAAYASCGESPIQDP